MLYNGHKLVSWNVLYIIIHACIIHENIIFYNIYYLYCSKQLFTIYIQRINIFEEDIIIHYTLNMSEVMQLIFTFMIKLVNFLAPCEEEVIEPAR